MKLKRLASTLLCISIAAIAFSGCKNHDEVSVLSPETVNTLSVTEGTISETEAFSQTHAAELPETSPTATTAVKTEGEPTQAATIKPEEPAVSQTTITETAPQETTPTVTTTVRTESAPPQTTTPKPEETTVCETTAEKASVEKNGSYTTPEDVAEYIHTFGTLPKNFITKSEAKALGWDNSKGNLWDVAEGKSIGGDYFGNYEGLLPSADGRKYTECDVNYSGGYRGSERIIFSNDGLIYYTKDHYKTFTQLY